MSLRAWLCALVVVSPQVGAQQAPPAAAGVEPTPDMAEPMDPRAVAELARRDGLSIADARRYAELGCDSGTTPAMTYCAEYLFIVVDLQLNELYKEKLAASDREAAALLQQSQRAWLTYRESACEYESSGITGNQHGFEVLRCQREITDERVSRLKQYVSCTQNGCP